MRELRPDERLVCNWLSQYEALPKEQVIRLLHYKPRGTAEKIIRGLNKEHRLVYLSQGYYVGVDSQCKADWKTVSAMWVLLHFIEKVEPEHHRKGNYPAQIFFLKEGIGYDERGFVVSKTGTYGTASWMKEKELKEVLELSTADKATGMILGERKGQLVCLPENTRLNRHCAIFGASGTMKSRAVIRNSLFSIIRRGESAIISDPKSEMYNDMSELFRKNGYEVKVFNLVDPEHSDSWNCMAGLGSDTMMAQVLANVIIGNTSEGKGDKFWDNGELNLLKALILLVSTSKARTDDQKNLSEVYWTLINHKENEIKAMFDRLDHGHPAKAPFNLFAQSSDTVRSGIILGLGTRLQVLQNKAVTRIISGNDIDLIAPGKRKCAYFMPKGVPNKRYTGEFKQMVVETMMREKLSYREAARQFEIRDHNRVASWERIYLMEGAEGLYIERRGRSSKGRPQQFPKEVEEDLLKEVQRLRAENAYLKKLQALVLERERRQGKK